MDKQRAETVARALGLGLSVAVLAGVVAVGAYRAGAGRRNRRVSRLYDYRTWKGAPETPVDPPETSPYPAA